MQKTHITDDSQMSNDMKDVFPHSDSMSLLYNGSPEVRNKLLSI